MLFIYGLDMCKQLFLCGMLVNTGFSFDLTARVSTMLLHRALLFLPILTGFTLQWNAFRGARKSRMK